MPVVQTRHPTEPLADERIAQLLTDAFPPHRCTVEFQDDRRRVALRVRGPNGAELSSKVSASIYCATWTHSPSTFETCGFI